MAILWNPDWRVVPVGSVNVTSTTLEQWRSAAQIPVCITFSIDRAAPHLRQRVLAGPKDYGYWPVPTEPNCVCVFDSADPNYSPVDAVGLAWNGPDVASCIYDGDSRIMGLRVWHEILHCMLATGDPDKMTSTPGFVTYLIQKYGYNDPFVVEFRDNMSEHEHDPDYQEEFYTYLMFIEFPWCISGAMAPPVAEFEGNPRSGDVPLTVVFTNLSQRYRSCTWDFGDGTTSLVSSPLHTYTVPGNYTVGLTVYNESGIDTKTKIGYIAVGVDTEPLTARFSANPTSGPAPLRVQFTDTSTGSPTRWSWSFGDGYVSNLRNPVHVYSTPGVFDVSLTVGKGYVESMVVMRGGVVVTEPEVGDNMISSDALKLIGYAVPVAVGFAILMYGLKG